MTGDRSYVQALEELPEPHVPLLGPVPCIRCGAWLEWAGVRWLNAGTRGEHDCAAFLQLTDEELAQVDMAEATIVASWTRPTTGLPVRMAHPAYREPVWLPWLGLGILALAAVLLVALAAVQLAEWAA